MTPGGKGARPCRQTPHSKDDIIQALEATRPGKAELGMRRARFNATASGAHLHLETPLGFAWGRFIFWCGKPATNVIREMTDTPSRNVILSALLSQGAKIVAWRVLRKGHDRCRGSASYCGDIVEGE